MRPLGGIVGTSMVAARRADLAEVYRWALTQGAAGQAYLGDAAASLSRKNYPGQVRELCRRVGVALRPVLMTICVDEDLVRVVAFKGGRAVAWGSAVTEAETTPEARASQLRTLLGELGFGHGRAVVELPIQTPLFRYFEIPKMGKRYRGQVICSEVLEAIPFAGNEVDITWQCQRTPSGQQVYAVAVAKREIDTLMTFLRGAGVRPRAAYSRAMSLARASGIADGIVVHTEAARVSAVLLRGGVPQVVHQVPCPLEHGNSPQRVGLIGRTVNQRAAYQRSMDPSGDSDPLAVVLAGLGAGKGTFEESIRTSLKLEGKGDVRFLDPPIDYPSQFPTDTYAANMVLAVAARAGPRWMGRRVGPAPQPPNLLPKRHLPRSLPVWGIGLAAAVLLLVMGTYKMADQVGDMEQEAALLAERSEELSDQDRKQQLAAGAALSIQEQIEAATLRSHGLEAHMDRLATEMETRLERLKTVAEANDAAALQVSSIAPQGDKVVLSGTASSYQEILRYAGGLSRSGYFSQVTITQAGTSQVAAGPGTAPGGSAVRVSFQISATPSDL